VALKSNMASGKFLPSTSACRQHPGIHQACMHA
jgi:hypothetical protein